MNHSMPNITHIAYVYSGSRKDRLQGQMHVDYPDTPLYGANHLATMPGIEVTQLETGDILSSSLVRRLLGFRIMHALTYFLVWRYDIVIGSSLFYPLVLQKLFRTKTKYVYLNFSLTRFIRSHKSRLMRQFVQWILDGASVIVCPSHFQEEVLRRELPNYTGRIAVVPLGVDASYYTPQYEGREECILSVGRDNGRDYATVIETARQLPARKFVIVCSVRNMVGISDVPSNVTIRYDMPGEELRELYYRAQLMLLITHDDLFGDGSDCSGQTVLLDAMASGLPVIASRKKYVYEYVREGEEALLVDFYRPQDVEAKIRLLEDAALRSRLAHAARARIENEFSTRKMAEGLFGILKTT